MFGLPVLTLYSRLHFIQGTVVLDIRLTWAIADKVKSDVSLWGLSFGLYFHQTTLKAAKFAVKIVITCYSEIKMMVSFQGTQRCKSKARLLRSTVVECRGEITLGCIRRLTNATNNQVPIIKYS
jgi:hypothetical protein